ncbi:DUF2993 domain-containing protein [Streptomyces sp. SL13]|jgi:hypothetical protein|uniref:DUF2993 domain-containing protein n=1 Tax=Streptantibioticus silvisoli TaxID=2705255 RepID=A0AA90GX30_9ACTN|nr:DUF2993 domain-containing protein [Streptantibioticus silvisoli]MDI5969474.1 DUF2993 domain-containing protein [Streptantibioticus silvisoli]
MRLRWVRVLVVLVVVLAGLFVAADRIAVSYAEHRAAQQIKTSQGLSAAPSVDIKGFPFLTQVLGRRLNEVTVTADGLEAAQRTAGGSTRLRISHLSADLHDVRLSGDFRNFVADTATGSALVSYADLSAAAPVGATVGYGGTNASGQAQVKVTFAVPGISALKRSVTAGVSVTGGDAVRLKAGSIPKTGIPYLDDLIASKADFTSTLYGLPSGITLASVRTTSAGMVFTLTGHHVSLNN